tara:strand:+ start:225106 stop:225555 length:450 start_codon:yes stop_codon:yes gene_type:complete
MEFNEIKLLLEKYEEGETSLTEEKQLKEYFTSEEVPKELEIYKNTFQFAKNSKNIQLERPVTVNRNFSKYWYAGIAASILLLLSFLFFDMNTSNNIKNSELGTIEDPEQAYLKTKETLKMIAEVFNDGREDLEYLDEFNKTKDKFIKEQ